MTDMFSLASTLSKSCVLQDVMDLIQHLYLVLTNEDVRFQLQYNARTTAEQFTPIAITER